MLAPAHAKDQVLGLLYVDNLSTPNTFSDEDLQFLVAFAGLAAIGVQNSRYAEQIRREATCARTSSATSRPTSPARSRSRTARCGWR